MTGEEKVLFVLRDRGWHTYRELLEMYYKYTQRIFTLRRKGYIIEDRPNIANRHAYDYKLVKAPAEKEVQRSFF